MRICILGPGAVGSLLGGLAAAGGHAVRFVGRTPPAGPDGTRLRMTLPWGWRTVDGLTWGCGPTRGPEDELLLVCLGRQHTRLLKKGAIGAAAAGRPVVLCNADPAEADRLGVPAEHRLPCVTLMSAARCQERDVELHDAPPVLVVQSGSPAETLFKGFASLGVKVHPVRDTEAHLNALFVRQLLFLPVALCGTTLAHFLSYPEGRDIAARLLEEGLRAMEKTGRRTARLPVMDPAELLSRVRRPGAADIAARHAPDRAYPSALYAFQRGALSEARELNKRVVEIAAQAGIELPWNWRLFQKAGRPQTVGYYRTPAELLQSLA
jgi:ketopantoate reductase